MAEQVSKTITLRYPITINGKTYPNNVSLEVEPAVAADLKRLDEARLQQELKRMDGEAPSIQFLGHQG